VVPGSVGAVITSIHTLVYSDDAPATRAFLRDVLGLPYVEDAGSEPGWLIFGTGPSEMGVHPTSGVWEGEPYSHPRRQQVSLMCDDIEATRADLEAKGARFLGPVSDEGFGLVSLMEVPGADPIMVYEPRHPTAYDR
jgi:catechol 2,3-dioxygenase-like lactoylglutathione lyase family enzyme